MMMVNDNGGYSGHQRGTCMEKLYGVRHNINLWQGLSTNLKWTNSKRGNIWMTHTPPPPPRKSNDSVNRVPQRTSCKRLVPNCSHELHESKLLFVSSTEFIRSKLPNFSAHLWLISDDQIDSSDMNRSGHCLTPPPPPPHATGDPAELFACLVDSKQIDVSLSNKERELWPDITLSGPKGNSEKHWIDTSQ